MPIITNPEVKRKLKESRLKLKSGAESLLDAGLSHKTAYHNVGKSKLLKTVDDEIRAEFKLSDITVEYVINNLKEDRALAMAKGDYSSVVRVDELLGKYLAIFTDKMQLSGKVDFTSEEKDKAARTNRLKTLGLFNEIPQEVVFEGKK